VKSPEVGFRDIKKMLFVDQVLISLYHGKGSNRYRITIELLKKINVERGELEIESEESLRVYSAEMVVTSDKLLVV